MPVHIAIVLGAEWANGQSFMDKVKATGNKDFLITYFGMDTDRKRKAAADFAATYVCHPYTDRPLKDKRDRPSTKRKRYKDG